ncbi:phosphate transporter PHO1-like [Glycine soja]|uniref:Phosphate transporter PHO1 n=1 Tax=Glycine soja TaxID=3848 RepID=A0A0B2PQU0_GLYSO|nr:phosphate transporter PHO1-like [Glycine soja]KHN10064.1 Phosphate transporter PHO1 [Glycine soja]RZB85031.1 Phosphate transporter PHO1 [Glycine soja]
MVKFSKELEAQLIPEWKEAFVNYRQLKKHIKRIKLTRVSKQSQAPEESFGRSVFDSFRFIKNKFRYSDNNNLQDIIQVRRKTTEESEEVYETELAQLFSAEDEVQVFFAKLDGELNKVNQFYKKQETEFVERGEMLKKQLNILLDLKQILSDRRKKNPSLKPSNTGVFPRSPGQDSNYSESNDDNSEVSLMDEVISTLERNGLSFVNSAMRVKTKKKGKPHMAIRIDIPATTPTAVTSMLWEDLVNSPMKPGYGGEFINKRKIQCAEKMIRSAFVELYKGLGLLKTYSSLNMVAFTKILKKFDKVSCQKASANYLKEVKRSHFISSDKVVRLMDEVESIFTKHFANNDRKRAMKFLRPQQPKASHMVTFLVGLCTGCSVSLFCVYVILAHMCGIFSPSTEPAYMDIVYPVSSVFALLSLHLFMYGCNLYMWKSTRINHNFIFEFSPSTALKHRDAFLMCTTLMTTVFGAMVIHLLLRAGGFSPGQVDAIPGIIFLFFVGLLICPFDIFYRPTRFCFIRVVRNIACSPFYKVLLVDFFMADQLTSQIPLLRHLETTGCHIFARVFKSHHPDACHSGRLYIEIPYLISFLPYWWRAMQCARRWFDDSDVNHLANMGKYVSAMVAAGARVTYSRQDNHLWFAIVLITSVVATVYQLYWDFVKDWGFFNPKSKNPLLRDDLILKNKSIYYMSMALNVVLRVAWVETIVHLKVGPVQTRLLDFLLASLEVIRRGHWNFYRLENEHLNNVGRYRAVKAVPLPFRDIDSDS